MTDYYDPHYANYEHQQAYYGEPEDEDAIRRSATRGSHQSQATASTKSWVHQNQRHPPPPPPGVEDLPRSRPASQGTPFHGPRPLPDRHLTRRPVQQYVEQVDDDDATEYMGFPNDPMLPGGLQFGYQSNGLGPERPVIAGPSTLGPSTPMLAAVEPLNILHKKTFVGGFFKGLKKIPKIVLGRGEKGGLRRRGTFGTEGTATTLTGISHGNTLPRYLSNPSIGPSNPQFAHRLSMAVANGALPPEATPAVFQMRNLAEPQYPQLVVTPPSAEGTPGEPQRAEFYDGPPPPEEQEHVPEPSESYTDPHERTTVMVYNTDSQAPTITQVPPSQSVRPPSAPRVSYPAELPTRASAQAQPEPFLPPPLPPPLPIPQVLSPALVHPSPRRPTPHPSPLGRHRNQVLSPGTTSVGDYTVTSGLTSQYDPSFASDLGPIEKFFKGLYNLPWIGHNRITVDYRPGDTSRAKGKMRSLKIQKPMASWYRGLMSLSRRNSLDLMSSEGGTNTVETLSPRSFGNTLSRLGSPISRRSGRSSERRHHHHHHHSSSKPKHRRRRRRTVTSAATTTDVPRRAGSPIVPTVYPYPVPPYPPYSYPYFPYPTMPMPESSPRGSRPKSYRRAVKYPQAGYTPYQPMAMPPPMPAAPGQQLYFMGQSPPQSQNGGDANATAGQSMMHAAAAAAGVPQAQGPIQLSPVLMHYVPTAYAQNPQATAGNAMISPPISPQRPQVQR